MTKKKTTKKSVEKSEVEVQIPAIDIRRMELILIGDSPMIQHRWSEKAKKAMLDTQMKKPKKGKDPKDPEMDFAESVYIVNEKKGDRQRLKKGDSKGMIFGFPSAGFKAAAVGACRFVDGITMVEARGAFHVMGEFVELETSPPKMREDAVPLPRGGSTDLRYRCQFDKWKARLHIRYNATALSAEQIVNLFNVAGFGSGIGEWRPNRNGPFGMFHVAQEAE